LFYIETIYKISLGIVIFYGCASTFWKVIFCKEAFRDIFNVHYSISTTKKKKVSCCYEFILMILLDGFELVFYLINVLFNKQLVHNHHSIRRRPNLQLDLIYHNTNRFVIPKR